MSLSYDDNSIRQRKGADRIRLAPAQMLGSNGLDGAKHTVYEIIGNATDEKLSGHGNELKVYYYPDNAVGVRDYGRGVPLGWNKVEGNWNYFLIYEELFAGGKYDKNQEILEKIDAEDGWSNFNIADYPYLITIGLNGVGAAATQFTSEYFDVTSYRDGTASSMHYEKGEHVWDELKVEPTTEGNGTFVKWKPDSEVFTEAKIPSKWLEGVCKSLSYIAGFKVTFNNCGDEKVFPAMSIEDYMKSVVGDCITAHNFTHSRDETNEICICDATAAIGPKGLGTSMYHNMVSVSGGIHSSAINSVLYTFFMDISKECGVKIRDVDYSGKFSFIVATLGNKLSPRGQTKDSIDDPYVGTCLYEGMISAIRTEYKKGTPWLVEIVNEVIQNAQNRIVVSEMSKNLKELEKKTRNVKASDKFVSCLAYEKKQYNGLELFIVEGDSAGGRAITARDSSFQCVLQIRGKSLNLYKASIEKLLANKEIQDFIAAVGCGVDLGIEGYESFDISKLRFEKIIILADADVDGEHINMLEFVKIFKLCPELLYQGYVYVAISPLYCITTKTGEQIYCMTQAEVDQKRAELGDLVSSVDRFKGHGETDADGMWNNSMNPATRTLKQLKIDRNDVDIYDTLETLFGKSTINRKRAILGEILGTDYDETLDDSENIAEYIDSLELSMVDEEVIEY